MPFDISSRSGAPRRALRLAGALIAPLVATGCGLITEPEVAGLTVELSAESVAPGGGIEVTLRNGSDRSWYYNGVCNSDLQRRDGDDWAPAYEYFPVTCGLALVEPSSDPDRLTWAPLEVPPGGSRTFATTVPENLVDGEYRVLAPFSSRADGSGTRVRRPSPVFQVRSASLAARGEYFRGCP